MKKNVILLTGIVFLITLLAAGGCNSPEKKDGNGDDGDGSNMKAYAEDKKEIDVFLKDSSVNKVMYLYIYDEIRPDCGVLNDHLLVVKPGLTINWKKDAGSNIDGIEIIKPEGKKLDFFGASLEFVTSEAEDAEEYRLDDGENGIYYVTIPLEQSNKKDTIVKYEIHFTLDNDNKDTTYVIDPYLKLPKQQ